VGREDAELKDSARRLLYTIRRLSDEALFRKEKRVLYIDLAKGEYWEGEGRIRSRFADNVFVKSAVLGGEAVHGGALSITCFPSGLRDEASITLSSKGRTGYTLVIPALGERFELREE
jgi:hypothetical protein